MNRLLAKYKNGNYIVKLYEDGTKIKETQEDKFIADFPDSIDLKITNYCDLNCKMCHENSSTDGKHAGFEHNFLNTLKAGTELAIGGGNPLSHPNLIEFLSKMKAQKVICNLTVNETHFQKNQELLQDLINKKLIYGLGISLNKCDENTILFAKNNKNVVFHIINGLFYDFDKITNQGLKVLILGYKKWGRGEKCFDKKIENQMQITKNLVISLIDKFECLSFDNLALSQLDIKNKVSSEVWDSMYMGDDGEGSMYIDLVKEEFALSSISKERFKIEENIEKMFKTIQKH